MADRAWMPLSAAQHGIWLGQQLDPASPLYNTAEYVELRGPLDAALLEAAVRRTLDEAEALHARIALIDGAPLQRISREDWPLPWIELGGADDPHGAALDWMRADLATVCDLSAGPLFAAALLRLGADRVIWYLRAHHVAADGYSFALITRRAAELYGELAGGKPAGPGFGALAAVIAEDRGYTDSAQAAADREFWRGRLADAPPPPSLASETALAGPASLKLGRDLPADLVERLGALARPARGGWPDALVALVAGYVAAWTGSPRVSLGLPLMSRLGSAGLRVPCMAMNITPLLIAVDPTASLADLTAAVVAERTASRPHGRYRYEQLRRDLGLLGAERRLFGPVVNIMPFDHPLSFGGCPATSTALAAGPVEDIAFNVSLRGGRLRLSLEANPACYGELALAGHLDGFASLLAAWLERPEAPLSAVRPVAPPALLDGGPLETPLPDVVELIRAQAERQPAAVALAGDGAPLSYRQLVERAQDWAGHLNARGIGAGSLVGIALPRSAEAIVALLATVFSGAAYLPIDPQWPAARLAAIVEQARPDLLLTNRRHWAGLPDGCRAVLVDALDHAMLWSPPAIDPAEPAYVMYTSGSTGAPKGVVISHGALAGFVQAAGRRYGIGAADRVLQFAPLHFDASVEEIFVTLCHGGELVLRDEAMLESPQRFMDGCARRQITVLDLPTAFWHELAASLGAGAITLPDCVRTVIIGGEAALPERVRAWLERVPAGVRLLNTYGPTEATVVATVAELRDPAAPVAIGAPLPGVAALLLGPGGRPVAAGEAGDLYLLGSGLASGYHRRPDLDGEHFVRLERLPGSPRAYRTGDRARLGADGQLVFAGRSDDEFKISGQRIMPAEVESVFLRHPAVREAAVAGQILASGAKRLLAAVALNEPAPDVAALRAHALEHLPAAVVPAAIVIVERLPRTASGKIDRRALTGLAPALAADVSPASPTEALVRAAWEAVLGLGDLDAGADFFALGGHSLQTIQVANRLGLALGREVPAALIFRHPTIAGLAAALGGTSPQAAAGPAYLADAVLDLAVVPERLDIRPRPIRTVLLTGATGFVGAHLLAELLRATSASVICLVRAASPEQAMDRLRESCRRYGLNAALDRRVEAIPADLGRERCGLGGDVWADLARRCDLIIHNAAVVSVVRDYASLRAANVLSTAALLGLAAAGGMAFHYVSTLAVAPPRSVAPRVPETFVTDHAGLRDGYSQSKWAAERLVEQAGARGLPVAVYRLGRVVGPDHNDWVNRDDLFWRIVQAGVPQGALPALPVEEVWNPVDWAARLIVGLARRAAAGEVYNLAPGAPLSFERLLGWVGEYGYPVELLGVAEWVRRLEAVDDPAVRTTLTFFERQDAAPMPIGPIDAGRLEAALDSLGIPAPVIDRARFCRFLDTCVRAGLLPAPALRMAHSG